MTRSTQNPLLPGSTRQVIWTQSRGYLRDTWIHTHMRTHATCTHTRARTHTRTRCLRIGGTDRKRVTLYEKINPKCKITFLYDIFHVQQTHFWIIVQIVKLSNVRLVPMELTTLRILLYAFIFTNIVSGNISFVLISVVYICQQ